MKKMHELTNEQKQFAEEHHTLVYKYLSHNELSIEEFYDVAIFGYLLAVQEYLENPDLSRFSFTTVAWLRMRNCIAKEFIYRNRPKRKAMLVPYEEYRESASLEKLLPNRMQTIAESLDNQELALKLLSKITPKEKEVVILKANGYTYREIAARCNITVQGVGSRFHRLRSRLCDLTQL